MSQTVTRSEDEATVDMTDRRIPVEREPDDSSHLVYWNAAKCSRCGKTFRRRGRGLVSTRESCPEVPKRLVSDNHNFAHGERGGLTTWNHQPEPTAEEILNLDDKRWRQLLEQADY